MAILSISEAARQAGVARSTIQRALKEGRLSATPQPDGQKGIDTSELYRVFGEPRASQQGAATSQSEAARQESVALQQQVELLRQELGAARDREQWYRGRIEQLEQRLLPPPRKSWVDRLGDLVQRLRGK